MLRSPESRKPPCFSGCFFCALSQNYFATQAASRSSSSLSARTCSSGSKVHFATCSGETLSDNIFFALAMAVSFLPLSSLFSIIFNNSAHIFYSFFPFEHSSSGDSLKTHLVSFTPLAGALPMLVIANLLCQFAVVHFIGVGRIEVMHQFAERVITTIFSIHVDYITA